MATDNRVARNLDHSMPAAHKAALGSTLDDLCNALADMQAKYTLLLTKLDAAGVAGGTNATAAGLAYGPVGALGSRKAIP